MNKAKEPSGLDAKNSTRFENYINQRIHDSDGIKDSSDWNIDIWDRKTLNNRGHRSYKCSLGIFVSEIKKH